MAENLLERARLISTDQVFGFFRLRQDAFAFI